MTLRSNSRAVSIAGTSSAGVLTLEMPTLEPRLAGFTNTGKPSAAMPARTPSRLRVHSARTNARAWTTGNPAAANNTFITALSMPAADASTPGPTYGTFASSSSPCTVPSSPYGPCSTGKTTSNPRPVTTARSRSAGVLPSDESRRSTVISVSLDGYGANSESRPARTGRACVTRANWITSAADSATGGRSASVQRPSFSMRMGTGS